MKVSMFHRPVSLITVFGERVRVTPGVLAHFADALYNNNINLYAVSSGAESLTIMVDYADEEAAFFILKEALKDGPCAFSEIVLRSNKAVIQIDATDLAETPGVAHAAIKGLAEKKINMVEMFSSYGSITIIVDPEYQEKAFQLIKASLKESFPKELKE